MSTELLNTQVMTLLHRNAQVMVSFKNHRNGKNKNNNFYLDKF